MIPVRWRFLLRAPSLPNRRYPPSSLPTPSSLPSTAATHACPLHPPHWLPADWMDDTSFQRSSALPNSEPRPSDLQNPKYNLKGVHRAWRRADLSLGDNCTQIPVRTTRGTLLLLRHDTVHAGVAPPAPHPQPPLPSTVATLYRRDTGSPLMVGEGRKVAVHCVVGINCRPSTSEGHGSEEQRTYVFDPPLRSWSTMLKSSLQRRTGRSLNTKR